MMGMVMGMVMVMTMVKVGNMWLGIYGCGSFSVGRYRSWSFQMLNAEANSTSKFPKPPAVGVSIYRTR